MLNKSPEPIFQFLPSSLELLLVDIWSESETLIFSNAHSSSVCFLFSVWGLSSSFQHHNIHLMFSVPFLFLEVFAILLFCLLNLFIECSILIYNISTRAVILAKLFSWSFIVQVFGFWILKEHSFTFLGPLFLFLIS